MASILEVIFPAINRRSAKKNSMPEYTRVIFIASLISFLIPKASIKLNIENAKYTYELFM